MTRILCWNINNFSLNKIQSYSPPAAIGESADRLNHILNQVLRVQVPDIFIILECYSRIREVNIEGTVIGNRKPVGRAAHLILNGLRTASPNWMLVPIVNQGSFGFREGTAVYYNSTNLNFIGPYIYGPDYRTATPPRIAGGRWSPPINRACPSAATAPPVGYPGIPAPLTGAQPYPADRSGDLPNRLIPLGFPNQGINENRCAAQWEHYDATGNRIYFPGEYERSPLLTSFIETLPGGGMRTLNIYSVHTSPNSAGSAMQYILQIPAIGAVAANNVNIIIGDFNVDTFSNTRRRDAAGNFISKYQDTYLPFISIGYQLHLSPVPALPAAGVIAPNRLPYCLTHLLPTNIATPFNNTGVPAANPTHNVYPRFGYMGSMGGRNFANPTDAGAIDNVLTNYGPGTAAPAINATIINTITGKPYNALATPPAGITGELTANPVYNQTLANPLPLPGGETDQSSVPGPQLEPGRFQQWVNYGLIHSVSDHLAIMVDV